MQAMEGFHRGLLEGTYMSAADYEAVKTTLDDALPRSLAPDHKDALRSRIRYGNEISLRKRLDTLASRLSGPIRLVIFGSAGNIPRQWIDTRNYYTRTGTKNLEKNVLDGQGMYYANVRLKHFVRALYLDLMGIPQAAILAALANCSDPSQHLIQINAIERRAANPNDTSGAIMRVVEGTVAASA